MTRHGIQIGLTLVLLAAVAGCEQQMAHQPRYSPLEESVFFRDKRSARPLVKGTIDRSWVDDPALTSGIVSETGDVLDRYSDEFPFRVTEEVLERGRERYNIWCAVCHDRLGTGQGTIVKRGYLPPPSFHGDTPSRGLKYLDVDVPLREAPLGYYFEVITRGYGGMPAYASEVPVNDRWAIIAYIRALQLARNYPKDKLTPKEREAFDKQVSTTP